MSLPVDGHCTPLGCPVVHLKYKKTYLTREVTRAVSTGWLPVGVPFGGPCVHLSGGSLWDQVPRIRIFFGIVYCAFGVCFLLFAVVFR